MLRTIPFATLQDGQQFLIERYAVAMPPSLSLTDPRPFWREDNNLRGDSAVLIAGLSEGVQGFSPLPSVARELTTVSALGGRFCNSNPHFPGRPIANKPHRIDGFVGGAGCN